MYALINKMKICNLSIDIKLKLFDQLVVPVILFGCEIWGDNNIEKLEKLHLKYCKYISRV